MFIYIGTNPDSIPEHKEPAKTIEWLKKNAKDMSFNGVKDDLIFLSSSFPYVFDVNHQTYELHYLNDNFQISDTKTDKVWNICERDLYIIWDKIRNNSVFSINEAQENEVLIYGLLYAAGYLSKIKILNPKVNCMENGYQINAGLGRVLAFKEA